MRDSLRARIVAFMGGLLLLSAALLEVTFYRQERALLEKELSHRGDSLARSIALHSTYAVITGDEVELRRAADWAFVQPDVAFVEFRDAAGRALIRRDATPSADDEDEIQGLRSFMAPVLVRPEPQSPSGDELLAIPFDRRPSGRAAPPALKATVVLGISTVPLEGELRRQALLSMLNAAVFLSVAVASLFLFLRIIVKPIQRLEEATSQIASGDFSRKVHVRGGGEIARLAGSFNTMVDSLLRSRQEIERHEADLEKRVRDRTVQLQTANEELRAAQHQLVQAEKLSAVGQLVSGVAHELNNPLASICGYAELLEERSRLPERVHERVGIIRREADRCRRIVQDLLTFARTHRLVKRPLDLNQLLLETLDAQRLRIAASGVQVELRLDPSAPQAPGDAQLLQQVLVNLIGNALDAMASRPGQRRLGLDTSSDGGEGRIMVSDNGPGIPPEILGRIFEPFFTTKEVGKGTGLGLSLCYGIMQEHGGRIQVSSAPGGGACFLIALPLQGRPAPAADIARTGERLIPRAQEPLFPLAADGLVRADAVCEPDDSTRPPVQEPPGATSSQPLRVLVVDDEPHIAMLLEDCLTLLGHSVATASDGLLAVERLASSRFDLIFTDMRMPGLDGAGLYAEVQSRWPTLASRLIFVTGDQASQETRDFLARSGARCLAKPFSLRQIEELVAGVQPAPACADEPSSSGPPVVLVS